MNLKEAVAKAKQHVAEVFADEAVSAIRLEEIEFDDTHDAWNITIGFDRPISDFPYGGGVIGIPTRRVFKSVAVSDANGAILSIKHRAIAD